MPPAPQWHTSHNIPIAKYVVPHYYEIGSNAFGGLQNWGVQFIGTHMAPGLPWTIRRGSRTGRIAAMRPARLPRSRCAGRYYADFMRMPGHPEFDDQFFNCVTEIRDDLGYEWYPTNDVTYTVEHGTRQLKRALDSRVAGHPLRP